MKSFDSLLYSIKSLDLYGYKIGVTYKGEDSYKTWPGVLCTLAVYFLVAFNLCLLSAAFLDNSNQEEIIKIKKYDRF